MNNSSCKAGLSWKQQQWKGAWVKEVQHSNTEHIPASCSFPRSWRNHVALWSSGTSCFISNNSKIKLSSREGSTSTSFYTQIPQKEKRKKKQRKQRNLSPNCELSSVLIDKKHHFCTSHHETAGKKNCRQLHRQNKTSCSPDYQGHPESCWHPANFPKMSKWNTDG